MPTIKLTKGELKKHRDSLFQFLRYLPTLQLKKQQLQIEILRWNILLEEKARLENSSRQSCLPWTGLLAEPGLSLRQWIVPLRVITGSKNIAGVDLSVFERAEFLPPEYDLFLIPAWVDRGLEYLRELVGLREEIRVIKTTLETLKRELRITTQRVNLFEKVKIPQAEDAIRRIKIYIGDQMANAVGRCKIAKRKIEELAVYEVVA
jgi:V/A-type H+-transporting ATPase subunit D